jgi:hypothetical protein
MLASFLGVLPILTPPQGWLLRGLEPGKGSTGEGHRRGWGRWGAFQVAHMRSKGSVQYRMFVASKSLSHPHPHQHSLAQILIFWLPFPELKSISPLFCFSRPQIRHLAWIFGDPGPTHLAHHFWAFVTPVQLVHPAWQLQ